MKQTNKQKSSCDTTFPWMGFPKESACNAGAVGDTGSILGSGKFPGEGNGNPFQYSCLGNLMDRGAWMRGWRWLKKRLNNDDITT